MSERTTSDTTDEGRKSEPAPEGSAGALLTRPVLRIALAVLGLALLLFALDQAFGVDLLATETRRWIGIALLALVLISVAASGWRRRRPPA